MKSSDCDKPNAGKSLATFVLTRQLSCWFNINICVILSLLDSSWTMLTVRGMFRCYHSRSTLSRLSAVFSGHPFGPPASARTRLLSSQDQRIFHISLRVDRYQARLISYREFATTSTIKCDAIGKIQSTHYHLIYTCKVPVLSMGRC